MNKQELIQKLDDIEWEDFEVKEARSEIPKNSWETVSAFSNTAAHYKVEPVVENEITFYKIEFPLPQMIENTTQKTVEKTVEKVFLAIQEKPDINAKELELITGLTRRGVEWNLRKLKEEGRVRRVGPDKGGHWEVIK